MRQKVKVEASKTVYTYSYLNHAAANALVQARSTKEGQFYICMTAELFSAFCLEAFLNHIGSEKLPYWESIERKLGPKEKLIVICHEIGLTPDFESRPFQSFNLLFQLRNSLVHGKTEYIEKVDEQLLAEGEDPILPEAKWKSLISIDKANQFYKDMKR